VTALQLIECAEIITAITIFLAGKLDTLRTSYLTGYLHVQIAKQSYSLYAAVVSLVNLISELIHFSIKVNFINADLALLTTLPLIENRSLENTELSLTAGEALLQ
jgi:hypothetical protein